MGKKIKSFSLAEMLIALLLTAILISATMPLITKNKPKGEDANSIACIRNDLVKNASLDITETACNSNPNSACCNSILSCRYEMTGACTTLAYYADHGNANVQNNARKVLREICDQGGEKACDYFAMSCKRDANVCDIPGSYDLAYYLNLPVSDSSSGKIIMQNLVDKYYNLDYEYIKDAVNSIADSCSACMAYAVNNGCTIPTTPWDKRFGGTNSEKGNGIAVDKSGQVYLIGEASDSATSNIFAMKLDNQGNVLWKKQYGSSTKNDYGYGIAEESGYAYLTGIENSETGGGGDDTFAMKIDSQGNIVWKKRYGGTLYDIDYGIAVESGSVYLTGYESCDSAGNEDIFVLKLDNQGNVVWKKRFGGANTDVGIGIAAESGYVYFTGGEISDVTGSSEDIYAIKLDNQGNVVWKKKFGGNGSDYANGIAVESGYAYLTGIENSDSAGMGDIFAIKLDNQGNVVWKKKFGGADNDYGNGIDVASGYVYLTGYENSDSAGAGKQYDIFAIKLDSGGNMVWKKKFGGNNIDYGYGIAARSGQAYLVGGAKTDAAGLYDIFVLKLAPTQTSNLNTSFDGANLSSAFNAVDLSTDFTGIDLNATKFLTNDLSASFSGVDLGSEFNGAFFNRTIFLGIE